MHTGPGGGNDVLARAIAAIVEKEKLLPVRMQVVNKTGGGGADGDGLPCREEGRVPHHRAVRQHLVHRPGMTAEAKVTMKDLTPIVRLVIEPAVIAVKSDAPYKSLQGLHRRGEGSARASSSNRAARSAAATGSCASCS